jgi:hypothetical protein
MQADRPAAPAFQSLNDVGVDLVGQHVRDDAERLFVGVAPALNKTRLDSRLRHCSGDGLAAAVDENRLQTDGLHEHDVLEERVQSIRALHDAAAQFDDDQLVTELPDIPERFEQDFSLANRFLDHRRLWLHAYVHRIRLRICPSRSIR